MISNFLGYFSHDIGIDLGTANTLVYVRGKGIIINEPSVVAINSRTNQILAIGTDAYNMVGRTPGHIVATRPLIDGVVSDFEITEQMLRYFIERVHRETFTILPRPRVVIGVPYGVTEVEKRAAQEASINAGAREVYLIEEPMAAAIGARLPIQDATGSLVVDIGGGTSEIAVISLGGIVSSRSLRIAGDELNQAIIDYARDKYNLLLGERTAEEIKIQIGSAYIQDDSQTMTMRGRDLVSGLPKELPINDKEVREALSKPINDIIESIRFTIEETPPELLADIMERGIWLTGGGALLTGLDQLIHKSTTIPTHVVDDPLTAVARGTGYVLEELETLKPLLLHHDNQPTL
ncbi:rod shape-determining protein [Patescibacteria group bacterium]|nr:rod shape-determining protein [Patescibacteria group bacterium]